MFRKTRVRLSRVCVLIGLLAAGIGVAETRCPAAEETEDEPSSAGGLIDQFPEEVAGKAQNDKKPQGNGARLEKQLGGSPEDPKTLFIVGECYYRDGDYARAMDRLDKAIQKNPRLYEAYPLLAEICVVHLKDGRRGDAYMNRLIEVLPNDAWTYAERAHYHLLCMMEAEPGAKDRATYAEKALQDAQEALRLSPTRARALFAAVEASAWLENADVHLNYCRQLVDAHPRRPTGYLWLAGAEQHRGNRKTAISVLRKGVETTGKSNRLLWELALHLIEDKQFVEAEKTLEEFRKRNSAPRGSSRQAVLDARMKHADACIEAMKGKWSAAKQMFEKNRDACREDSLLLQQCDIWIARCYGELGQPSRALDGIRQPASPTPEQRIQDAVRLSEAGRLEEAIRVYETLIAEEQAPPGTALELARLFLLKGRCLPNGKRNWDEILRLLDQAEKIDPDRPPITTLRAVAFREKGEVNRARTILDEAIAASPTEVSFRDVRTVLEIYEKNWDEVEKQYEKWSTDLGDSAPLRLARVRYLLARHGKAAAESIRELGEGAEDLSPEDKKSLLAGLFSAATQIGDHAYAQSLAAKIAEESPQNLGSQFVLFESAARTGDRESMRRRRDRLREIEGKGPCWHYATAFVLVSEQLDAQGKEPDRDALRDALKHLAQAHKQRPDWARVLTLAGTIYEKLGERPSAIKYFKGAVELGERNPGTIRSLVVLLFQEQRFDEADRAISLLGENAIRSSKDMTRIWAEIKLLRRDYEKALELARECAKDSEDYRDHVWLGRVSAALAEEAKSKGDAAGMKKLADDAQKQLTKALQMNQTDPQSWIALVQLLNITGDRRRALNVIEQAKKKIEPAKRSVAVAKMYEIVGDAASSSAEVVRDLKAAPEDPIVVRRAAEFYLRRKRPDEAAELLGRMIAGEKTPEGDVAWARQRLSLILLESGGYQNRLKAIGLMDAILEADPDSIFDLRIKARILASLPTQRRRKEAIAILERILKADGQESTEDRFVLARLYAAEGDKSKASAQMRRLLSGTGTNPRYLETFIRDLVKWGEGAEAAKWVDQLEKLAPDSFAAADAKALVLAEEGKTEEAIGVLLGFVDKTGAQPRDKTERLLAAAKTLASLARRVATHEEEDAAAKFSRAAEEAYRRYADTQPERKLILATFFAEEGRVDEAIEILEDDRHGAKSRELGAAAFTMIRSDGATEAHWKRIEKVLEDALANRDNSASLLLSKAELRVFQGRAAEAEQIYRDIIKGNSRNVVALNNLAVFLANRREKLDEALRLVNRCIELAGPVAALLDSRGCVHLAREDWDAAIEDLETAVSDSPPPTRYFHLAEARLGAQDLEGAKDALKEAHAMGLSKRDLRGAELGRYEALLKAFGIPPAPNR